MSVQTLNGSCLCGAIGYSVTGTPARFMHCHCSRCRKATGSGHSSNLFFKSNTIAWSGDTNLIRSYKIPDADRFTRTFCSNCGGPLPREIEDMQMVFIPAGTLDNEPDIRPQARIFTASRASWSCSGDDIPSYPDYPG